MSADQADRQKKFDEQNDLGFPLLSDPKKKVAADFGVKRIGPLPVKRTTFVIDTDRTILGVVTGEFDMNTHADEALEILRASQA